MSLCIHIYAYIERSIYRYVDICMCMFIYIHTYCIYIHVFKYTIHILYTYIIHIYTYVLHV